MPDAEGDREVIPDTVTVAGPVPVPDFRLPRVIEGRLDTDVTTLAWRARMRWLDDGGR